MGRIEKTVFISYRRTNFPWALCIYQDLTHHGFDVFFDYQSIDSGDFEKIILENIRTRAHFIVILSPSALERCNEPGDWLRREIEIAVDERRNIIPVMLEGFDFGSPSVKQALIGKLASLSSFSGMGLVAEYAEAGFEKLRTRFLNVALEDVQLHPLNAETKEATEAQRMAASRAQVVDSVILRKQESFELEYAHGRLRIPIIGPIAAGLPLPEISSTIQYLTSNDSSNLVEIVRGLLPPRVHWEYLFALEVKGDSMKDAMINDGDIVIMEPATSARNGEMAAIWLPRDNEATLKYFFNEKDRYRLQPANSTMKPIYISKDEPLEIKGKVVMVIRKTAATFYT